MGDLDCSCSVVVVVVVVVVSDAVFQHRVYIHYNGSYLCNVCRVTRE